MDAAQVAEYADTRLFALTVLVDVFHSAANFYRGIAGERLHAQLLPRRHVPTQRR